MSKYVILAAGVLIGGLFAFLDRPETRWALRPRILADGERVSLEPATRHTTVWDLSSRAVLEVAVVEPFGKNIESSVLEDGKAVFDSGVKKGRAEGRVPVNAGKVSVVVTNANAVEGKTALITVVASRY
jgi:uncharacterized membrane protein